MYYTAKILYLLVWLLLLVHCLKRKRFFPIFSDGVSTKVLWLVTFIFFNPLLTLLYIVFGVIPRPSVAPGKTLLGRISSVIALILLVMAKNSFR